MKHTWEIRGQMDASGISLQATTEIDGQLYMTSTYSMTTTGRPELATLSENVFRDARSVENQIARGK